MSKGAVKCGDPTCSVCTGEERQVVGGDIELRVDGHFVYKITATSPEAFGAWLWDFFQSVPQNAATLVELTYCKPIYEFPQQGIQANRVVR